MSPRLLSRVSRRLTLLALIPALAACSSARPTDDGPTGPVDEGPGYPAYESFDASAFDAPPPEAVDIVHDVPSRTMEGTVQLPGTVAAPTTERQPREVDGYRIQVGRSEAQSGAESIRNAVLRWWESAGTQAGAPQSLEVVVTFIEPYYRVRVGAYEFQEQAQNDLDFIRREYNGAFVVPDRVTVR
ncbi:MAG: SPOR domain-containing protein [Bacteroidota bacterium]